MGKEDAAQFDKDYEYDVAISYASEDGAKAEELAAVLRNREIHVFYDKYEKALLWGKDLYLILSDIFQSKSRYCILLLSRHYAAKAWTKHELQSAQAGALKAQDAYLLPIRLDDTEIPGILPTIGYLDWSKETPDTIADLLIEKLIASGLQINAFLKRYLPKNLHKLTHADFERFNNLMMFVTANVRTDLLEHFSLRGIKIKEDLSISVNWIISSEAVISFLHLSPKDQQRIRQKQQWIFTIHRDVYTQIHVPERTSGITLYHMDHNTAFRLLLSGDGELEKFCQNDLESLGAAYEDENREWRKYYNATLMVPIRYQHANSKRAEYYGVLAVDSSNTMRIKDLFSTPECKDTLSHAADFLASFFPALKFGEYHFSRKGW